MSNPLEYTMHSITKGRRALTASALAGFWLSYGVDMELVVGDGGLIGAKRKSFGVLEYVYAVLKRKCTVSPGQP